MAGTEIFQSYLKKSILKTQFWDTNHTYSFEIEYIEFVQYASQNDRFMYHDRHKWSEINEVPDTMPSFIAELYLNLLHSKVMANKNIQV